MIKNDNSINNSNLSILAEEMNKTPRPHKTTSRLLRVFMSYKREDIEAVRRIEEILHANGIRLWRDLEYLPLGINVIDEVKNAINKECSGFLVYITENSMASDFIWEIEIPTAYLKSKRGKGKYPLIPVFQDRKVLEKFREKSFKEIGIDLSLRNGIIINGDYKTGTQLLASKLLENMIASSGFNPIEVFTHGPIPNCSSNTIVLDWTKFFHEDHPTIEEWKNIILPALVNLKSSLLKKNTPQREVWLPSRIHLSASLLYGWTFRSTTGFKLIASESLIQENPEGVTDTKKFPKLVFNTEQGDKNRQNLALGISIAKDVTPTIQKIVHEDNYSYKIKSIGKISSLGSSSIINTHHAKHLAEQTVEHLLKLKNQYNIECVDLFISSSVQFAAYLGWYLNACGDFRFWQFNNKTGKYKEIFRLNDIFDTDT